MSVFQAFKVRPGFSLLLWPFLLLRVAFAFDSPIRSAGDGLVRVSFALSILCYPLAYLYGVLLSRSRDEARRLRASFWLAVPWTVLGFWLIVFILLWLIQNKRT